VLNDSPPPKPEPTLEERLRQLAPAAQAGDAPALAELRRLLDTHPDFWQQYADLAGQVQRRWMALVCEDVLRTECLERKLAELRAEVTGPSPSPLERLLAERVVACWLQVQYADMAYLGLQGRCTSLSVFAGAEKRQGQAQRRLLAAIKQLALVRKLLVRPPAPIEVATRLTAGRRAPGGGCGSRGRALGVSTEN
jgi:hypothetical protein